MGLDTVFHDMTWQFFFSFRLIGSILKSPSVPLENSSYLVNNRNIFFRCYEDELPQISRTISAKFDFSYLMSNISTVRLVDYNVLVGSKGVASLRARE